VLTRLLQDDVIVRLRKPEVVNVTDVMSVLFERGTQAVRQNHHAVATAAELPVFGNTAGLNAPSAPGTGFS
jgi:hypothetical protein